jgi:hypothetical protein
MNKETVIAVIMVGLIILAGVQAIEINSMKNNLAPVDGPESPSAGAANTPGATRYSSDPSSAGMVGGC